LKNKHKFIRFLITGFPFFWALLIAFLSLMPESVAEKWWFDFFIPADKIAHFIIYFVFTFSIILAINFENLRFSLPLQITAVAVISILYGILMEILQKTAAIGRSANLSDVLADSTGVFAGILLFFVLRKNLLIIKNL